MESGERISAEGAEELDALRHEVAELAERSTSPNGCWRSRRNDLRHVLHDGEPKPLQVTSVAPCISRSNRR
jgi:hypothetical protein